MGRSTVHYADNKTNNALKKLHNTQRQIIKESDAQMQILDGLRMMKSEAEKKIGQLLAEVWGVEVSEPVIEAD